MLRATLDPNTKRIVYRDDGVLGASVGLAMPQGPATSTPAAGGAMANPGRGQAAITLPEQSVTLDQTPAPAPGGAQMAPSMSMGQMPMASDPKSMLGQHLAGLESKYGLPQGYLAQTRAIESSNGTNLANPNSSARGPYQFIDKTARAMGLSDAGRMDEFTSADAAARLAAANRADFERRIGTSPTGAQLYGMHQQGSAGYLGLLNGQTPGGAAQALNGAGGMDAKGQLGVINRMYANAKPDLPGDPSTTNGAGFSGGASQGGGALPTATATSAGSAVPVAVAPQDQKFTGGLAGLLQGSDYTGAGASKDLSGKMGDFVGSSQFKAGMSGIAALLGGGGGGQAARAPGIQSLSPGDEINTPNMALMQLYGQGGVGRRTNAKG